MQGLRVLIADSSPVYKKMFTQAVETVDGTTVKSCDDSEKALEMVKRQDFEVIVINADIPGPGLFAMLKWLKLNIPNAFVLVTARPSPANDAIFSEALAKGATECITKPIYDSYNENFDIIVARITEVLSKARDKATCKKGAVQPGTHTGKHENKPNVKPAGKPAGKSAGEEIVDGESDLPPELVLIAVSTGGPQALESVIPGLREDFPVPILIVQHIPSNFTMNLARQLGSKSKLTVKVAEHRETISAGTVYFAPGGTHMKLDSKNNIRLDDSPPVNGVRPSADVLFKSVAEDFKGKKILAIVLTGMGNDGKEGVAALKARRYCYCISQSEATCVVYGMPRAVEEAGLADKIVDLDEITSEIERMIVCK